jgi:putative salt-induced outer membrane protein
MLRRLCVCLVLLVASAVPAFGQAPAPQAPAPPPPPPPRTEGSGEVAFVNTAGNAESTSLGLRGEFIYRPDPWVLKMRGAFVRLESEDELEAQSFTWLFRAERPIKPRLSLYAQHDYLRDLFAGIEHKNVVSGGVSYKAIETERQSLILDGGLGVSSEQRVIGDDETTAVLLGGLGYKLKISATTDLTEDVRYEQSLSDGDAWRLDNAVAIVATITSIFSLKVSNVIRYANEPVDGFESTDTITSVALVAKF